MTAILRFVYLTLCLLCWCATALDSKARASAKVLEYTQGDFPDLADRVESGQHGAIYRVAKDMLDKGIHKEEAIQVLHTLADHPSQPHMLSQVALGFVYYGIDDKDKALHYFSMAGARGPHQASLYNVGRIYAEAGKSALALAYIKSAYRMTRTDPNLTDEATTASCQEAFDVIAKNISSESLSLHDEANAFLYGNLEDFPVDGSEEENAWKSSINFLLQAKPDFDSMQKSFANLHTLWENNRYMMSPLQKHLLLHLANRLLSVLNRHNSQYLRLLAQYSEMLAVSKYCYEQASSDHRACFNDAISTAACSYRRLSSDTDLDRVYDVAQKHSRAATHWTTKQQTPAVLFDNVSSNGIFDASHFTAVRAVEQHSRSWIYDSLEALFDKRTPSFQVGEDGESVPEQEAVMSLIVYDGNTWDDKTCSLVPQVCDILKDTETGLCQRGEKGCHSSRIVELVRYPPKATQHAPCGLSNAEATMFICLSTCKGLDLRVGSNTMKASNLQATLYDESFDVVITNQSNQAAFALKAKLISL
jgi:tetratricopeptide (TPR) repeat protein